MLKIKDILIKYKKILKERNFETYSLDTEVLLMEATGLSKSQIYISPNYELNQYEFNKFESFFKRRLKNEPIAYIIGKCEFMGLNFNLNKDTLIPRSDTEILVEKSIDIIKKNNFKKALDIGTGSGAIAISIAKYCDIDVTAVDINENALSKAKENAINNNISQRIEFIRSDLFENINQKYDIIISNPPYINTDYIDKLEDNVKKYEPLLALDGGFDGLDFYKKITKNSINYLNKKGYLIYEIGFNQANDVKKIMHNYNFKNIEVYKDLANLDRVILGNFKEENYV